MIMDAKKCLQLLRDIKDVAFSTVDDQGKPQVRMIDVMLVENEKLYFCTARGKDFYKQLHKTKQVAIVGMNAKFQMIRVSGVVELLENRKEWMDRIFVENPSMHNVYPNKSRYILEPFCICSGDIEFFDLGKTPIYRETFVFGKTEKKERGFCIMESCINCGNCYDNCPQQCIDKGKPYTIKQNHCLHCGLCVELCPVSAIQRRA